MTATVIDITARKAVEPLTVPTPGWALCPLTWCADQPGGPGCYGGDTHIAPGGVRLVTDRIHTRTVEYVTGSDVDGSDIVAAVTLTAHEDHDEGVYDIEVALQIGDDTVIRLTPAAADALFAGLAAAARAALKPPAATRPVREGGGRASTETA
jgi:hypothetical protein